MTTWTKERVQVAGWYVTAHQCNMCERNPLHWVLDTRVLQAGDLLSERMWRSVDPITPPSEERT